MCECAVDGVVGPVHCQSLQGSPGAAAACIALDNAIKTEWQMSVSKREICNVQGKHTLFVL